MYWDRHYRFPTATILRSPKTMVHIKDITHQLTHHCKKFETWVKQRDTFFSDVSRDLKNPQPLECYQAWKSCMAAANLATERYLLDYLQFTEDRSTRVVHDNLSIISRTKGDALGLNESTMRSLESDPLHMASFLLRYTTKPERIPFDVREYSKLLAELNDIRRGYVRSSREAKMSIKEALQKYDEENQRHRNVRLASNCLQTANPARVDTSFTYIAREEPELPDIESIRRRWEPR
jgi:hypothetical protein